MKEWDQSGGACIIHEPGFIDKVTTRQAIRHSRSVPELAAQANTTELTLMINPK